MYQDGCLLKADQRKLVSMHRERTAEATQLVAHELSAEETNVTIEKARQALSALLLSLSEGNYQKVGQVPEGDDIVTSVRDWLTEHPFPWPIAERPNAV